MDFKLRFAHATLIAEQYADFRDFAEDGMVFLGFSLSDVQADIAEYMQCGPRLRMVMAQRGEAKSTLAALYAVWCLIQRPSCRVLVVSGGEKQASEVALLVIRTIMQWDILEYLRPDKMAGDRVSIEAFDVHHALKGLDKSPSVACIGITANLQGKRADLLIADDIETSKNGLTAVQRGQLLSLSKEFTSICTHGDILYLGTPQTKDSIYNTLPGRGFCIRIWPGRYPTQEELEKYSDRLAPIIAQRLAADPTLQTGGGLDGSKGRPTDPQRFDEHALCEKELDQGPEGFQLQFMLDTTLSDEARQQLKLSNLVVANYDWERLPEIVVWQPAEKHLVPLAQDFAVPLAKMYYGVSVECQFIPSKARVMYIDPAGGGTDELAYGVSASVGPYIHLLDVGGLRGGLTDDNGQHLVDVIREFGITVVTVESNMGHGLFEINLRAILEKAGIKNVVVGGEYSTGQKERRIIDSFVSATQRHRIVVHPRVFESDKRFCASYSAEKRTQYSFFYQFNNITTDRGSLPHDDRLEAAAGAVRHWKAVLVQDENKAAEARRTSDMREHMRNPMGYSATTNKPRKGIRGNISKRRGR